MSNEARPFIALQDQLDEASMLVEATKMAVSSLEHDRANPLHALLDLVAGKILSIYDVIEGMKNKAEAPNV